MNQQMKSLLNPEDGAPVSEEISQRSTQRAHRAAKRGAWRIAGDGDEPGRDAMAARGNGKRSVPQIFIDDQHVGGCDELHGLERAGKLDALLAGQA